MDVAHCHINFSTKVSTLLTDSPDVGTAHRSHFHPWADIATIVTDESPSQAIADRPAQTTAALENLKARLEGLPGVAVVP